MTTTRPGRAPARAGLARTLVAALAALLVLGTALAAGAQDKRYKYETDPIRLGMKKLYGGDLDGAKADFDEAITNSYRVGDGHRGLAEILYQQARYDEACAEYAIAASDDEAAAEAHAGLGLIALRRGDAATAANEFQAALGADDDLWRAHYGLARLAIDTNDLPGAEKLLEEGKKKKGLEEGEDLYRHGMTLLLTAQGKFDEAEDQALKAMLIAPANPDVVASLGDVYDKKGVRSLAIEKYEQIVNDPTIVGNKGQTWYRLGKMYQKEARYTDAVTAYEAAVKADSTIADAYLQAGAILAAANQHEPAARAYLRYTTMNPKDADGLRRLSDEYLEVGMNAAAYETAKKAYDLDSTRVETRIALARTAALTKEGAERALEIYRSIDESKYEGRDYKNIGVILSGSEDTRDDARIQFQTAIELDSTLADAYARLGFLDLLDKDYESAEANLARAVQLNDKSAEGFMNLGLAQLSQSQENPRKLDAAVASFKKAVELAPKSAAPRASLAQALSIQQRFDEAEAMYREALMLDQENRDALGGLGYLLLRKEKFAEAEGYLVKATQANPNRVSNWVFLGQAQQFQGKVGEARASYDRALALDPGNKEALEGKASLGAGAGR